MRISTVVVLVTFLSSIPGIKATGYFEARCSVYYHD